MPVRLPPPPQRLPGQWKIKALMSDVVNLKAFVEAAAVESAAVVAAMESAVAAAAVTMMGMVGGGGQFRKAIRTTALCF